MESLARWIVRRRRFVLVIALLGFLAMAGYGVGAFGKLSDGGQVDPTAPSSRAEQLVNQHFGGEPGLVVLVTATRGTVDSAAVNRVGRTVTSTVRAQPYVDGVTSYFTAPTPDLRSTDRRSALVLAHVRDTNGHRSQVSDLLARLSGQGGAVAAVQSGGVTATNSALTAQIRKDLGLVSIVAVPITVMLLYFVFGGLLASLLPLAVAAVAIMGTFAALRLLTTVTPVSTYAIDLNIALGLGLAVDYGLLYVSRFREEISRGHDIQDAIARAARTAGRTVLFSAITVALALTALLVFPIYFLKSFAYAGISVVAFAVTGALFVLPALLAALCPRVTTRRRTRRHRVRTAVGPTTTAPAGQSTAGTEDGSRLWTAVATRVTSKPLLFATPVALVLVLIGLPLLHVHFSTPDERALPASTQPHQVGDALRTRFADEAGGALAVVAAGPARQSSAPTPADTASWQQYSVRLSKLTGVTSVRGPAGTYREGRAVPAGTGTGTGQAWSRDGYALWTVDDTLDPAGDQAATLVRAIRDAQAPVATTVWVGGRAADLVDQKHSIGSRLPWAVAIMTLASFVMLFLFTGSVLIPLKALVLNAVTLFTVVGAMVWVFQGGHLDGLLNFTPTATTTTIPPLLFVIAFGLSMDYEVFLISRIKELHDQGRSNRESIIQGMAKTGGIVTTAAALLCVTFFAFGLSEISFLQFFGLGTGLAVLLDAFVVRGVLVPAAMQLLGERIWWAPTPLRRVYERFGLREETSDADTTSDDKSGAGPEDDLVPDLRR